MAAVTAAAIGAAGAIYAANKASSSAKQQAKLAQQGIAAADPYAQYRPDAAAKLNALMNDPKSIEQLPEYQARMQAAQRQMAAQGYTGSGNALVEAANAGGAAYQQAFSNLSMLSGAGTAQLGGGYANALNSAANASGQQLSGYAGVANNLSNLALTVGQKFNQGPTYTPQVSQTNIGAIPTVQPVVEPVPYMGLAGG